MAAIEATVTIAILLVAAWLLLGVSHKPASRARQK